MGMYNLFSKSDKYFIRYMSGYVLGRKLNVWDYYRNYFENLRSIGENLFTYEGISDVLKNEIEKRLFFFGKCGIVEHEGDLVAVNASPCGEDIYNNPISFTFNFGGGISSNMFEAEILKDGILAKNTETYFPTALFIEQYALSLAHCEMSIICEMVNGRFMDVLKAHSNRDVESAREFTKALYNGDITFLTDKTEDMEIDRASVARASRLAELLDAKDRILKEVYNSFGINKISEKRERFITEEVNENNKFLSFNVKDMLECRKKMCHNIKNVFGVDVKVKCHIDIDSDGKLENEKEMENNV